MYAKNDFIVMIHERNGRTGDLTCLFTMDYLLPGCGLQSSDYRYGCLECICSRSEPLFCKNCTFLRGISSQKAPFDLPKIFCMVGETSTHVQFLLGFLMIYAVMIRPPGQNIHSQSTGAKEIFENPTCCWIFGW